MKNKKSEHIVSYVVPGSIAEEVGIEAGDILKAINDTKIEDILDYHFLTNDEEIVVLIEKENGEEWEIEIEKDYDEDLGIEFKNPLMDEYRSCCNKCIFCFIDQMPKGMRDTLYFKDDDSRLSFLQGNYITLTNLKEADVDRIIRYHMAPINVSVHTTDPELRCRMLHNRFAGEALAHLDSFYRAGIEMNGQIVLCKGWNDGENLEKTISDLTGYAPVMQSLSVVPFGMTKYRDGLEKIEPFNAEECRQVVECVEKWQRQMMQEHGIHFVHASDEFYIMAGLEVPEEERYDGYLQLENGVGMTRLMENEAEEAIREEAKSLRDCPLKTVSIGTGFLAKPQLERIAAKVEESFAGHHVKVFGIRNDFFGETITVSGLVTGRDLINQLTGKELGDVLLLPQNMFRSGEEVFLDDVTKDAAEKSLQVPIRIVKSSGAELIHALLYPDEVLEEKGPVFYEGYENQI